MTPDPSYDGPMPRRRNSSAAPDFETLVATLHGDVWLLCRHLGDTQSADDLTQETFLRVHKALPAFRGDASPKTWVLAIARRVCADEVRQLSRERRRMGRLRDDVASAGPDQPDVADAVTLWALVDRLDVDRRAAFVLTQVFGLSYDEAATVCECPIGTIRSRVARARIDLVNAHAEAQDQRRSANRRL
jgi:RNA polymerase sigma-70 factor (ECF subfamily)